MKIFFSFVVAIIATSNAFSPLNTNVIVRPRTHDKSNVFMAVKHEASTPELAKIVV